MPRYVVQVHGEWSGLPEFQWMDIDFEAETFDEVKRIIEDEIPMYVPYMVYDNDMLIIESVK